MATTGTSAEATALNAGARVHMAEEEAVEPAHPVLKKIVAVLCGVLVVVCLLWTLDAPLYLGIALYGEQFLAFILGLALGAAYLSLSWRRRPHTRLNWLDVALALLGLSAGTWIAIEYPRLALEVSFRTPEILTLAGIIIVLVIEALRRATGWSLLCVVLLFFAYALFAEHMPTQLQGKPFQIKALASYLAFDPSAVFGTPLAIGASIVLMFLWMGEALIRAGGGEFFLDLSMACFGKRRGGPAKICVVGSALFGMISGSAVSNVASIGVLTIPMMKRTGYSSKDAGAIEAVGSTGGQLMPPVMGAAAFLMAEFLEITYAEVCIGAAIPAALYYWGLYCQVDLIAGKGHYQRLTERMPILMEVVRDGWHLVLPIAALLFLMFQWGEDPEVAAIGATVGLFVVGAIRPYRGRRIRWRDIPDSLAATGRSTVDLFLTLAAAGFVIGVLNATGLAFALTLYLVNIAGQSAAILLLLAGGVSLLLGMGMPTTAVYILCATLVAPSLVEAGIAKFAAHMFILYFGMLSMITPPVALAAFAAANISKAGPMETGWAAVRIGWAKFVLPFMFVLSPTLLMRGTALQVVTDAITAWCGIYFVTIAIIGYYRRPVSMVNRAIFMVCGAAAIVPSVTLYGVPMLYFSIGGVVVGGLLLLNELRLSRGADRSEGVPRPVPQVGE
jgi:TRAP transporter 4TM/12TM fusion protein